MDILNMTIVKQTNGKFACWNSKEETFDHTNYESAEAIKARILRHADLILTESIIHNAQDDNRFKRCVEDFKIENGLSNEPQEWAAATLEEMGVSVEDC